MLTKSVRYILLLSALYSIMALCPTSTYAEDWALFVAIDDYRNISPDLRFCESDARRMQNALINYAGFKEDNIKMLVGKEATKKNVKKAFKTWLIDNVKPGDKAFFYFSGHGVQMRNPRAKEEVDGKDELLCLYDSARHAYTFLRDNELGNWMDKINTDQKIVILDCCHSGTGTRGLVGFGEQSDNVPRVKAYYPEPDAAIRESTIEEIQAYDPDITEAELASALGSSSRGISTDTGGETSISGCDDHQVSLESPSIQGGVLTNYLIESMRSKDITDANRDGVISVRELWEETQKRIKKKGWHQDPQYYGSDNVALIGTFNNSNQVESDSESTEATLPGLDYDGRVKEVAGEDVQLSIGSDDGVTRGSLYGVYNQSGNRKAQIHITHVEPMKAHARPLEGGEEIHAGDWVIGERHHIESKDLLLLVEPFKAQDGSAETIAGQLTEKIRGKIGSLPNVKLVGKKETPDRILTGTVKSQGSLFNVSLRLINVNIGNSTRKHTLKMYANQINSAVKTFFRDHQIRKENGEMERVEGFASLLRASYVQKALVNLENPKPKFAINVTLDKGDLATYNVGETVEISMKPTRDCYVYVLDIGSSGKINLLFPSEYEPNNFLKKGQKYTIPSTDEYAIELGGPIGDERIKVIATTRKIPLDQLRPENISSPIKTYNETAPKLLEISMKDLSLKPRHTWATETVMFTVGKPLVYGSKSPLELSILE
ncbi:caspase family protein [Candidatus Poribacteria bacterium]|nr:caspase family protein [Candidatus Poribacteria bacterium]